MDNEKNIINVEIEKSGDTVKVNGGGTVTSDNGTIQTENIGVVKD